MEIKLNTAELSAIDARILSELVGAVTAPATEGGSEAGSRLTQYVAGWDRSEEFLDLVYKIATQRKVSAEDVKHLGDVLGGGVEGPIQDTSAARLNDLEERLDKLNKNHKRALAENRKLRKELSDLNSGLEPRVEDEEDDEPMALADVTGEERYEGGPLPKEITDFANFLGAKPEPEEEPPTFSVPDPPEVSEREVAPEPVPIEEALAAEAPEPERSAGVDYTPAALARLATDMLTKGQGGKIREWMQVAGISKLDQASDAMTVDFINKFGA